MKFCCYIATYESAENINTWLHSSQASARITQNNMNGVELEEVARRKNVNSSLQECFLRTFRFHHSSPFRAPKEKLRPNASMQMTGNSTSANISQLFDSRTRFRLCQTDMNQTLQESLSKIQIRLRLDGGGGGDKLFEGGRQLLFRYAKTWQRAPLKMCFSHKNES